MTKKKRDLIVAVTLVLVFLLSYSKNMIKKGPAMPATTGDVSAADVQAAVSSLELVRQNERNLSAQEAFWEKDWGRDPFFRAGAETAAGGANLVLSGIVWDDRMPIAMINEKVLKVGDVIEGFKLTAINPSSVVVTSPSGKESEVQLFQSLSAQ